MKKISKTILSVGLVSFACLLLISTESKAAKIPLGAELINEYGFGDVSSSEIRLIKHKGNLLAITNQNQVYISNKKATNWELITPEFTEDKNNSYGPIIIYKKHLYLAFNNAETGVEIWKLEIGKRPKNINSWTQVGEDGLGDATNTSISHMWKLDGKLYIYVVNEAGFGRAYESPDGNIYEQIGVDGLITDDQVEEVTSARVYVNRDENGEITEEKVVYLSTNDGRIIKTAHEDWNNFIVDEDLTGATANLIKFKGKLYVSEADAADGVKVYRTNGDGTYAQVNEDGFGDANNINATANHKTFHARKTNRGLVFHTYNEIDGLKTYVSKNGTDWNNKFNGGFGNSNNVAISDYIKYRNMKIAATQNTIDGAGIYMIKKSPIKPIITSPENDSELSSTTTTIEGYVPLTIINKRAKVKVWINGELSGTTLLENDGTFSYEINNLIVGENELKFKSIIKGKSLGKSMGNIWEKSAFTVLNVSVL